MTVFLPRHNGAGQRLAASGCARMSVHEEVQKTMRSVLSDLGADVHVALSPTLLANRTLNVFMSERCR